MSKKLIIIIILFSGLLSTNVYAWDDCPYGKVNDEYPGECAKYIDTDNDGICDHSQLAPEDRNPGITVSDENSSTNIPQDSGHEVEGNEEELEKDFVGNDKEEAQIPVTATSKNEEGKNNLLYALLLVGLPTIVIVIYSVYQRKRIK